MTVSKRREPLPEIPIADALKELTGQDDIPTGMGWVRMRCPFHEDRNPSASVNHDVNGFRCYSCSRHGDSLKLLMTERGLTFIEALNLGKALIGAPLTGGRRRTSKRRASDLL